MVQPIRTEIFAPAKVNFFLGVTGMQKDGYHSLVSWVVPLAFGDTVRIELEEEACIDTFTIEGIEVDCRPEDNLVLKALSAFRSRVPEFPPVSITLTKNIPFGAGLGGGSSDAVAALKGFNFLSNDVLDPGELSLLAASLGSDCPLFLTEGSSVIRGRGEKVEFLYKKTLPSLKLLLFKPFGGVDTPWAYRKLRAGRHYLDPVEAERRLGVCLSTLGRVCSFFNSFEVVVFEKMPGLGLLIESFRSEGIACGLSGSGSACFAIVESNAKGDFIRERVGRSLGPDAFIVETRPLS